MKRALLLHGAKQTPVTVEETSDGGLIVHLNGKDLFRLEPVAVPMGRDITAQSLDDQPPYKRLELLIERFSNSKEDMSDLVMDLMDDYKRLTGRRYEAVAQSESQLQQDLIILKPHMAKLIAGGELARGWQSRVAEYLDLPNTGGAFRKRILAAGHTLREFYFSTAEKVSTTEVETKNRRVSTG